MGTLPIRVRSVKCNLPLLFSSASHPWYTVLTPLHIPSRVTRITSFSPNGHFGWQVHYTLYFQIVCPLLMPGRLIALAASPRKRADKRGRSSLKDSDYCFPLSLIEALERKDFNLVLLVAVVRSYIEMAYIISACSVNSSVHLVTFFSPPPRTSTQDRG